MRARESDFARCKKKIAVHKFFITSLVGRPATFISISHNFGQNQPGSIHNFHKPKKNAGAGPLQEMERDAVLDVVSGKMHLGCGHWSDRSEWQAYFGKVSGRTRGAVRGD